MVIMSIMVARHDWFPNRVKEMRRVIDTCEEIINDTNTNSTETIARARETRSLYFRHLISLQLRHFQHGA